MITGIGTDIVDIRRIAKLIDERGDKFLDKIFCPEERSANPNNAAHYAKRFAAKEAVAKALGTGIGELNFKHIKVLNKPSGQPYVEVDGYQGKIHLSLSDEFPYAIAYVIVEG